MTRSVGQKKLKNYAMNLKNGLHAKTGFAPPDTPRVMVTGTPMFWPDNWKLPALVEEGNPQGIIVADEQCSGRTHPKRPHRS
jgi:hypothetical protein